MKLVLVSNNGYYAVASRQEYFGIEVYGLESVWMSSLVEALDVLRILQQGTTQTMEVSA